MADPAWINASAGAPSYTAAELRRIFSVLLGSSSFNRFAAVEGIRPIYTSTVGLSGSTITVAAHGGVISPNLTTTQGPYIYQLPVDETHTLTAAHLTLARTDLVTMRVDDNDEDASGARTATSAYVVGTAGAGVPALPARSFELARIAVPASGGGSPALTERFRFTVANGGVLPVRDTADRPIHYAGRVIYQMDTNHLLVSDGAAWTKPKNFGGGLVVPPVKRTSDLVFTGTEGDVLTLAAATLAAGRHYRLLFSCKGFSSADVGNNVVIRLKEGSTTYMEFNVIVDGATARAGGDFSVPLSCTANVSAGSHTFKVTLQRVVGSDDPTLHAAATTPASLTLEDLGEA